MDPNIIFHFLELLDRFDSVTIEENQQGENVTLEVINNVNSGNNCLHFCIVHNSHRIVIQTYKYMTIPNKPVDIVQGKPELEDDFIDLIDYMDGFRNNGLTDQVLNKLFVFYCGLWQKCKNCYHTEMDNYICELEPNVLVCFDNKIKNWHINTKNASLEQIMFLLYFVSAIEDICKQEKNDY